MTLNKAVADIRARQRIKPSATDRPSAVWTGVDLLGGKEIKTLTIIFKTSGCRWGKAGGCTMCGYVYDSATEEPSPEDLETQLDRALYKAGDMDEFMLKIFTSGSFFDQHEIPTQVRQNILRQLADDERIPKVIAETRPEYVTDEVMDECTTILGDTKLEIAVGLETSSDIIRKDSINKGFTFANFTRASETAKKHGVTTKAYLMLKPPFLSEGEAMDDIIQSIDDVAPYADTISINLCNVQKGTFVEKLWQKQQYRPPWLWSIVEIIKKSKPAHPRTTIMSDPVAAGSKRGPHNCKQCSYDVADAIREFSITQDLSKLDEITCECVELWKKVLELDDLTYGSAIMD